MEREREEDRERDGWTHSRGMPAEQHETRRQG